MVCVVCRWLSLEEILDAETDMQLGTRDIITAVKLPVPQANDTFWSHKLSQRFWNAHAMINMAVWLKRQQPSFAASLSRLGVKKAAASVEEVRVVIGSPRAELQGTTIFLSMCLISSRLS